MPICLSTKPRSAIFHILLAVGGLVGAVSARGAQEGQPAGLAPLSSEWFTAWQKPALADLPLQIVHNIPPTRVLGGPAEPPADTSPTQLTTDDGMAYYLRRGRGGLVCNVAFVDYLRSEEAWKTLTDAVDICARLGMPVWIYDEEGYPSGAAGGLVLKQFPDVEALALVWDRDDPRQFFVRPAFEHTHASNNYFAVRRYINIIDQRATQAFVQITHEAYYARLRQHFGKTIVAFFTDEPSLMAVNLGPIPEAGRKRVRIQDEPDPSVKPLPSVPWSQDLAVLYQQRYGEDLQAQYRSLFEGTSEEDRRIRRQFWSLIADLVAERYFGILRDWCRQHNVASSGHNLAEESLLLHIPLYGNALKAIAMMDIPGLDMLSSDPAVVMGAGWLTACLPLSGALLEGNRRVMTEVSDFAQRMFGSGPVDLASMQAAAAWQAAWGVTEFTLYYSPEDRTVEDNWRYGQFVGRLNAILKPALPVPQVAVYYPVYDLWPEYIPTAERPTDQSQSERFRRIVGSFYRIGRSLQLRQIPFVLIDHEYLARASVEGGRLKVGSVNVRCLILPEGVELPPQAEAVVSQLSSVGGKVVKDSAEEPLSAANIRTRVEPVWTLEPTSDFLTLGEFVRDGRRIVALVNVGKKAWSGSFGPVGSAPWWVLNPHTGEVGQLAPENGRLPIGLDAYQAVLLIQ